MTAIRKNAGSTYSRHTRLVGGLLWSLVLLPGRGAAQEAQPRGEGVYLVPTFSIGASYDDNIFFSSSEQESSFFGRSSQGLALDMLGKGLRVTLGYSFDSEIFPDELDYLTDLAARQQARGQVAYDRGRTQFSAAAGYLTTLMPQELLVPTGLDLGRTPSTSYTGRVGFGRRLTPKSSWLVQYDFNDLELEDVSFSSSRSHSVGFGVKYDISARMSFNVQYVAQLYLYDGVTPGPNVEGPTGVSHVATLRVKRQVSSRTSIELGAGPRATRFDAPAVSNAQDGWQWSIDAHASVGHRGERVECSLAFNRTQQQVFGLTGFTNTESLAMGLAYSPHRRVRLGFSPGVYRNHWEGVDVWSYGASVDGRVQIMEWAALRAAYGYNYQDGRYPYLGPTLPSGSWRGAPPPRPLGSGLSGLDVYEHNVISVSLVFGYPFRL